MGSDTSVGSLTTAFTPLPSCLTDIYRFNASYTFTQNSKIFTYGYTNLGPTVTSDCLPSRFAPASVYYSPGICPSGYAQACSSIISLGSSAETRATCCPLGYACQSVTGGNAWPWYSTELCTGGFTVGGPATIHVTSSVSPGLTTTYTDIMSAGLNAYGISIRYQASDFATTTSSGASSSSPPASPASSSSAILATSTPTMATNASLNQSSSSTLSAGAIAGIVIGIVVLISFLAVFAFLMRQRKRRQDLAAYVPESSSQEHSQDWLRYGSPEAQKHHQQIQEVGEGAPWHELPVGATTRHELPGGTASVQEMEGTNVRTQ